MRSINDDSVMVIWVSDMDLNIRTCSVVNLLILIEDHGISHTWSTHKNTQEFCLLEWPPRQLLAARGL